MFGDGLAHTCTEIGSRTQLQWDAAVSYECRQAPEFFLAGWYAMFKSGRYNVMQAKLVHYP